MAERTLVVDDLAFADDPKTTVLADHCNIVIGLEGEQATIDLSGENKRKLDDALAPFILVARPKGRVTPATPAPPPRARAASNGAATPKRSREELTEIREWAREEGMPVSDMGQIPGHILAAWEARNIDEEPEIPIADRIRPVVYTADEQDFTARLHAWCGIKSIPIRRNRGKYGVEPSTVEWFQNEMGVLPPK